jgi:hypothetical protein
MVGLVGGGGGRCRRTWSEVTKNTVRPVSPASSTARMYSPTIASNSAIIAKYTRRTRRRLSTE